MKFSTACTTMLFLLTTICMQASDFVYEPTRKLNAGDSLLYTMPASPDAVRLTFRVSTKDIPHSERPIAVWSTVWNYVDADNYSCVSVSYGTSAFGAVIDDPFIDIDVYTISYGVRTDLSHSRLTKDINPGHGANSIDIDLHAGRLYIRAGNADSYVRVADINFEPQKCESQCGLIAHRNVQLHRERVAISANKSLIATPLTCREVLSRVSGNLEAPAGIWYYYDRNMPPANAALAQYYTLAVLPSADVDGGYDIYIMPENNETPDDTAKPKGRLTPSGFINEYDLVWLDANGVEAGVENSVSVDNQAAILVFHFPSLESQVRFRRTPNLQLEAYPAR